MFCKTHFKSRFPFSIVWINTTWDNSKSLQKRYRWLDSREQWTSINDCIPVFLHYWAIGEQQFIRPPVNIIKYSFFLEEKKTIQETYCRALVVDTKHAHTNISSKTPCWSWSLFAIFLIQTYKTHKKTLFLAEHATFVDPCFFSNIAKRKGMPINVL